MPEEKADNLETAGRSKLAFWTRKKSREAILQEEMDGIKDEKQKARAVLITGHRIVRNEWRRMYPWWLGVHYVLSSAAVILATLGASSLVTRLDANSLAREVILVAAAILTALIALFKPSELADRYRLAWATLGNAIERFIFQTAEANDELLEGVRTACIWGESIVRNNAPLPLDSAWAAGAARRVREQAQKDLEEAEEAETSAKEAVADLESQREDIKKRKEAAQQAEEAATSKAQNASGADRDAAELEASEAKEEREGYEQQEKVLDANIRQAQRKAQRAEDRKEQAKARLDKLNADK